MRPNYALERSERFFGGERRPLNADVILRHVTIALIGQSE